MAGTSWLPYLMLGGGSTTSILLMMFLMNGGLDTISDLFGSGEADKGEATTNSTTSVAANPATNAFDLASTEVQTNGSYSTETYQIMQDEVKANLSISENETQIAIASEETRQAEISSENAQRQMEETQDYLAIGGGVLGGAAAGAAAGAIVPLIGPVAGAILGGAVGGFTSAGFSFDWW